MLSAAAFQSILHALGVVVAFGLFLEISVSLSWALAGGLFLAVNPLLVTRVVFVLQEPTLILVVGDRSIQPAFLEQQESEVVVCVGIPGPDLEDSPVV